MNETQLFFLKNHFICETQTQDDVSVTKLTSSAAAFTQNLLSVDCLLKFTQV